MIIYTIVIELYCNKVNALNFDYDLKQIHQYINNDINQDLIIKSNDTTTGRQTFSFNFDTNYSNTNGYNFAGFPYSAILYNNYYQCVGSQCNGSTELITNIEDYISTIYLIGSDGYVLCQFNDGQILCPINKNSNYSGLSIIYLTLNGNLHQTSNIMKLYINRNIYLYNYKNTSDTQDIINNQNNIQQQNQQNWNNFNNSDISNQSKTPIDTTESDAVNQKETQIYDVIKQSPSELDILSIDLDPNTNNWIWTTINTLIAQHRYITILFVSIMTIGVAKLIFGR